MKQVGMEIPKVDVLASEEPLHLKVLRSPKPHAKIVRIEVDEALRVTDMVRVFTEKDIPGKNLVGTIAKDQPILASDRVRYIGDPVALIAAKTEEAAEEAARKLVVVYEDLPSITHPEEALQPYAPLIHEKGNLLLEFHVIKGDVQKGLKEAEVIVEETRKNHSCLPDSECPLRSEGGGFCSLVATGSGKDHSMRHRRRIRGKIGHHRPVFVGLGCFSSQKASKDSLLQGRGFSGDLQAASFKDPIQEWGKERWHTHSR